MDFACISLGRNCIIGMSDDFLQILLITLLICPLPICIGNLHTMHQISA